MSWEAKFAAIGVIAFGNLAIMDGLNEKGLAVGAFYFPTYAEYTETTPENQAHSMSMSDFPNWLLTSFETVAEVRDAIEAKDVFIAPTLIPGFPPVPQPFHYIVYDKTGASLVIEPVGGELKLHDNPIGSFTNSPTFDWHMTNLRNYIALETHNVPPIEVAGSTFEAFGQGSGLLGLPGDFTPPSRFVRASVFSSTAIPEANTERAVLQVFHILNNFDIPVGVAREQAQSEVLTDYTMLTTARDPLTLRYYWKSYEDQTIRMIDMTKMSFEGDEIVKISTNGNQPIVDMTPQMA